jgi:hypothetical protein
MPGPGELPSVVVADPLRIDHSGPYAPVALSSTPTTMGSGRTLWGVVQPRSHTWIHALASCMLWAMDVLRSSPCTRAGGLTLWGTVQPRSHS